MNAPKILIAEDEKDIRELLVIALEINNYTVIAVANGEMAVQQARQELPDLILLDVRMPKLTGYEACQALKQDPTTRDIPVVFLSAKGQETEIQRGEDLGAEAYILKPFAPDALNKTVKKILFKYNKL